MGQFQTILPTLAVLLLLGCGGKVPATHYYALNLPTAPVPAAQPLPHSVAVMPIRASGMLTQDRIVYRPTREEVGYYEYHRWAEDPRESVLSALIEKLKADGAFQSVGRFDGRTKADYVLRARIDRLEEVDFEGGVKVYSGVSAELLDAASLEVVWTGSAVSDAAVGDSNMQTVVSQLSGAMDESLNALVSSLASRVRAGLPAAN